MMARKQARVQVKIPDTNITVVAFGYGDDRGQAVREAFTNLKQQVIANHGKPAWEAVMKQHGNPAGFPYQVGDA